MAKVKSAILIFSLILTLLVPNPVQAQQLAKVDVKPIGVEDFWGITDVERGQKIAVKVEVGVQYESPRALDGFWLKIRFKKPSGSYTSWKWFDYTDEYISRGTVKQYLVKTGEVADEEGTWTVYVELWDKDKENRINYDSANFKVVETLPAAWVNVKTVVGYAAAAALALALAAYALRRV